LQFGVIPKCGEVPSKLKVGFLKLQILKFLVIVIGKHKKISKLTLEGETEESWQTPKPNQNEQSSQKKQKEVFWSPDVAK
jgi:hypothetical protein